MHEFINLKGRICIRRYPKETTYEDIRDGRRIGEVIEERDNLIVTAGKQHLLDTMISTTTDNFDYVGVGSGTTAAAVGQTNLVYPMLRNQCSDRWRSNITDYFSAFFSSSQANGPWEEAGLFRDASGGVMFSRSLFASSWTKTSNDVAVCEWSISF